MASGSAMDTSSTLPSGYGAGHPAFGGEETHFDGAGTAATEPTKDPHVCTKCQTSGMHYSMFAFLDGQTDFARMEPTIIDRAVEQQLYPGMFKNSATTKQVYLTCVFCCQKLHSKEYILGEKLTSRWYNMNILRGEATPRPE